MLSQPSTTRHCDEPRTLFIGLHKGTAKTVEIYDKVANLRPSTTRTSTEYGGFTSCWSTRLAQQSQDLLVLETTVPCGVRQLRGVRNTS